MRNFSTTPRCSRLEGFKRAWFDYPEPDDYLRDADSCFNGIVENSNLPCELRVKAASEWSALQTLRGYEHYGQALRLHLAYEDAIEQYKELFNVHHIDRKEEFG